jgi:hypothetical protein
MSEKFTALQLADALSLTFPGNLGVDKAAAELRRLSTVNAELLDALRRVMRHIPADAGGCSLADDMHRARAAIARATEE